ncbi:MAG: hypothetical protein L3J35_09425 [Bacteroidales bacterium]|nr:hypothetical protein [Bacteroidales bacterium]
MSDKTIKINFKDITDRIAENYLRKKSLKYANISQKEKTKILDATTKIKRKTLLIAALYGALGVAFLYIPQYIFSESFSKTQYTVPYINYSFDLSIFELLYGFVLVGLEIWLLMKGDLKAVSKIAAVYGHNANNENFESEELALIGLGKDRGRFTEVGINPYQNFSKTGVLFLRLLFIVKAMLSNFIFKIIIKKVLGRLAIRAVVDLAGIPIYAVWNAYASSIVIRKTDMRMKAIKQMNKTGKYFSDKYKNNKEFTDLIYDTFEYIAVTKKSFYPTDYIFAKHFFSIFNIKIEDEHKLSENYFEKIKLLPKDIKLAIGQILILGFLLDGKIGSFEIGIINKLKKNNIIPYSLTHIKKWTKHYKLGNGFDEMFNSDKNTQ